MIKKLIRMSALRQAIVLSLAFLVLLALGGWALTAYIGEEIRTDTDIELKEQFDTLAAEILRDGEDPDDVVSDPVAFEGDMLAAYLAGGGHVIGPAAQSTFAQNGYQTARDLVLFSPDAYPGLLDSYIEEDWIEDADGDVVELLEDGGTEWRVFVGPVGDGQLAVFTPALTELGAAITGVVVIMFVMLAVPALAFGLYFGLRAQRRLDKIGTGFEQMAEGDLSVRIAPAVIRDDLDVLAQRIDDATGKLQSSLRQVSDFSANIAHDLRTPLTRLRVHLDQAADADTPADHLASSIEQTDRILAIFDAIQRIARLRGGERRAQFAAVQLGDAATKVHEIYEAVAEDSEQILHLQLSGPATINGDENLIIQMLSNLIENAIRHAQGGARIELSVVGDRVCVEDNGPGIPADQRDRIFEPLYRLEKSRNTPGSGMGLSLVKAIADLHNATLSVADAESGEGARIEIRF